MMSNRDKVIGNFDDFILHKRTSNYSISYIQQSFALAISIIGRMVAKVELHKELLT